MLLEGPVPGAEKARDGIEEVCAAPYLSCMVTAMDIVTSLVLISRAQKFLFCLYPILPSMIVLEKNLSDYLLVCLACICIAIWLSKHLCSLQEPDYGCQSC